MSCVENYIQCADNRKQCPKGFIRCNDNTCRIGVSLCPIDTCPAYATHKCANGQCVSDKKFCDNPKNGCPFDRPHRCKESAKCVSDLSTCPKRAKYANCGHNKNETDGREKIHCLDGSYRFERALCPNE